MATNFGCLSAYLAWLCRTFQISGVSVQMNRRGNLPPPSGGFAA